MQIRRANKSDLPAIRYLMNQYGLMSIEDAAINQRDVGLCAYEETGELVGFVWAGFMAKNTLVYVDKFVVARSHNKKGVGEALMKQIFLECIKRGARKGFGIIKHDDFHEASAMNVLKIAGMADNKPYTYVLVDKLNTLSEMKTLGDNHGR